MNNYWAKRFEEEEKRLHELSRYEIRRQQLEYERALSKINRDIEVWYGRISKNENISLAEAKKLLSNKELKEFKWSLEEYIKHGKENGISADWSKQLENASAKVHIERLEALKLQVRGEIEKLYNVRNTGTEEFLKRTYKDQYYRTAYQIAKGTGIGTNLYRLNVKLVDAVVKKPWSPDGKSFSDRIWEDKNRLINTLHTELTQGFIRGDSLHKLTNKIAEKINVSKANAARLVYTESAAYSSRARLKTYEYLGLEKYEIVATLDNRTSEICQNMDGKVFDLKDYEVGTTAPPFHVRCRSTTAPYFEDDEGKRAARNEVTGGTEYVPANITYKDWKEKYLTKEDPQKESNKTVETSEGKYRLLGNIKNTGYNNPMDLFRKYEKKIVGYDYESAMVVLENGDIYVVRGKSTAVNPEIIGQSLKGAYITHNHPKARHEFGFSTYDISFFWKNKLKYLAAVDEKYVHEMSKDLFEMIETEHNLNKMGIKEFAQLDIETKALINQILEAISRDYNYRRLKHEY